MNHWGYVIEQFNHIDERELDGFRRRARAHRPWWRPAADTASVPAETVRVRDVSCARAAGAAQGPLAT